MEWCRGNASGTRLYSSPPGRGAALVPGCVPAAYGTRPRVGRKGGKPVCTWSEGATSSARAGGSAWWGCRVVGHSCGVCASDSAWREPTSSEQSLQPSWSPRGGGGRLPHKWEGLGEGTDWIWLGCPPAPGSQRPTFYFILQARYAAKVCRRRT